MKEKKFQLKRDHDFTYSIDSIAPIASPAFQSNGLAGAEAIGENDTGPAISGGSLF